MNTATHINHELKINALLHAPLEKVWEVWTKPEHIVHWWGPKGFTNTIKTMDVSPGGIWEFTMHGPDGVDYKNKSIYKEIIDKRKIVFEHVTGPQFTAIIKFIEEGNNTVLSWTMLFETAEQLQQVIKVFKADEGQKQNIEKLEHYLSSI
jgi:uncharacterized protein YndB with AHSA1/START domain